MSTEYRIFQLNAFTNASFSGAPAAVVPMEAFPSDDVLRGIASDNNLSETAFTVPWTGDDADFHLRWFTPTVEVNLCGHATLATAALYFTVLAWAEPKLRFMTASGVLTIEQRGDSFAMDFPALPTNAPVESPPFPCVAAAGGEVFNIYELASSADVHAFKPDFKQIAALHHDSIIITAKGDPSLGDTTDIVSRMFGPNIGIPEDPVTGAAHCALATFWPEKLGKTTLTATQVSARRGSLQLSLKGDRVELIGQAVLYLEGKITV
ncbi:PhzF family phenazine biosynthesis protein [Alphaproteobacteria bacterium]|nr:PhzF family phenazine biosynthesis protein [Alphaproteobacteria bacterium]MDG1416093.1 PhzF family phenazine biosynthesis isomerase [Alphaproteobacteria bacterium]